MNDLIQMDSKQKEVELERDSIIEAKRAVEIELAQKMVTSAQ